MKRRVLILGAAFEQVPAIKKAKELGYEVAVADFDPQAIGISLADKYYNCSTTDPVGVYDVARDFHADGIFLIATDKPVKAFAFAVSQLGLPGYTPRIAENVTDKGRMAQVLSEEKVPMPWFFEAESFQQMKAVGKKVTYPCIVKPVNNSASRGVVKVNNYDELLKAYEYSSSCCSEGKRVIIEEFMCGPEVSVEVLVIHGVPHVLQVTDKLTSGAPHFVELGHSQPSQLPEKTVKQIKGLAEDTVLALGLYDSTAHVEIIVTEDGPKIVEVGGRLGGDGITGHLVELSTGVDLLALALDLMTGGCPTVPDATPKGSAIRFITTKQKGILQGLQGREEALAIPGVKEVYMSRFIGEELSGAEISCSDDRVGHIITQGNNARDAIEKCEKALSKVGVIVAPK